MLIHILLLCIGGVTEAKDSRSSYINDYQRQNYDTIRALIPKGRGADIKSLASEQGLSVSQLIVTALEKVYDIDLSK